jgi:hypothetical protein
MSRTSVAGALQVLPPSVDLLTSTALPVCDASPTKLSDRLMKYAVPFGENVTHGSDARW